MTAPDATTFAAALACGRRGCACAATARTGHGMTHCPAHQDNTPSLKVSENGGTVLLRCHAGCEQPAVIAALRARGLWPERAERRRGANRPVASPSVTGVTALPAGAGLTVEQLAERKFLDLDALSALGIGNTRRNGVPVVRIPYLDTDGIERTLRYRLAPDGAQRFAYRRGDAVMPYGLPLLANARAGGWMLTVEGESDCWTAWQHGLPAVGIPGKSAWRAEWAAYLTGLAAYVWQEPGAEDFTERIARDIPDAFVIAAPDGVKDLSDAHIRGLDVPRMVSQWKAAAVPARELLRRQQVAGLAALEATAATTRCGIRWSMRSLARSTAPAVVGGFGCDCAGPTRGCSPSGCGDDAEAIDFIDKIGQRHHGDNTCHRWERTGRDEGTLHGDEA